MLLSDARCVADSLSCPPSQLYTGSLLAGAFSGFLSGGIQAGLDGVHGWASWRYVFMIEVSRKRRESPRATTGPLTTAPAGCHHDFRGVLRRLPPPRLSGDDQELLSAPESARCVPPRGRRRLEGRRGAGRPARQPQVHRRRLARTSPFALSSTAASTSTDPAPVRAALGPLLHHCRCVQLGISARSSLFPALPAPSRRSARLTRTA